MLTKIRIGPDRARILVTDVGACLNIHSQRVGVDTEYLCTNGEWEGVGLILFSASDAARVGRATGVLLARGEG